MFKNSETGISISDEAISFVKLSKKKDGFYPEHYGLKKIPEGVIEGGILKDLKKMQQLLTAFRKENKVNSARVSLPEAEEDFFADSMDEWKQVFKQAGISIKSFEPEGSATIRSVIKKGHSGVCMIINIGNSVTNIFIADLGRVALASVLGVGGETLVRVTEGEGIKKNIGLNRSLIIEEISTSTVNGISVLREELSKIQLYWNTRKNKNGQTNPKIEKIILCGSRAGIKGLDEFLAVSLKTKTELANVWTNILDTEKYIPEMTFRESLSYASALGAARGGF